MNIDKRYQVFVSSTYEDLQDERKEVMQALLELDCMPSGMELFPAANEDQWTLIKKVIDDCDYYIVILGGRYGSVNTDGISYTEMEYRYALQQAKPIAAFLHKDPSSLPARRTEKGQEGQEKLLAFRHLVERKMCKSWTTPADLGSVVSRSIIKLMKSNPGTGWVRADLLPDKDAAMEILNLRKEVDRLQSELNQVRTMPPEGTEDLAQGNDKLRIPFTIGDYVLRLEGVYGEATTTWNSLFGTLGLFMVDEAGEDMLRQQLASFVGCQNEALRLQIQHNLNRSSLRINVPEDDFRVMILQLKALRLIVKSARYHSAKDSDSYWTLTPYGDSLLTKLRAIRKPKPPKRSK
jgi:hypothetical protein